MSENIRINYSMVDLKGNPNYEKLAAAYDIPYMRISQPERIREKIRKFLKDDQTAILECIIDPYCFAK